MACSPKRRQCDRLYPAHRRSECCPWLAPATGWQLSYAGRCSIKLRPAQEHDREDRYPPFPKKSCENKKIQGVIDWIPL
jgi:hypothetical protein